MISHTKNIIFEKIKQEPSLTDKVLLKSIIKDGITISNDQFEKILLDLEIAGLISVSWMTKDTRRVEIVVAEKDIDEYEEQIKEAEEKSYEASFPSSEN